MHINAGLGPKLSLELSQVNIHALLFLCYSDSVCVGVCVNVPEGVRVVSAGTCMPMKWLFSCKDTRFQHLDSLLQSVQI